MNINDLLRRLDWPRSLVLFAAISTLPGCAHPAVPRLELSPAACSPLTHRRNLELDYLFAAGAALVAECDRQEGRTIISSWPACAFRRRRRSQGRPPYATSVTASSNGTPCFAALASALRGSHSNTY